VSHQALSTRTPVTVALAWRRSVSTAVGAVLAVAGLCFVLGFVQGPFFAVRCVQISAESRSVAYEVADRIKLPQGANTLFTPLDDIVRAALAGASYQGRSSWCWWSTSRRLLFAAGSRLSWWPKMAQRW